MSIIQSHAELFCQFRADPAGDTAQVSVTIKTGDAVADVVVCRFSLPASHAMRELFPGDAITVIGVYDQVGTEGAPTGTAPGLSNCRLAD